MRRHFVSYYERQQSPHEKSENGSLPLEVLQAESFLITLSMYILHIDYMPNAPTKLFLDRDICELLRVAVIFLNRGDGVPLGGTYIKLLAHF